MRLDLFLPALRKPKPGEPSRFRPVTQFAQRLLPASWFSNQTTKQRGLIRRVLRWLGPTWLSSPVRRLSQALCFALFLWLFFYVCYPYTRAACSGLAGLATAVDRGRQHGYPRTRRTGGCAAARLATRSLPSAGPLLVGNGGCTAIDRSIPRIAFRQRSSKNCDSIWAGHGRCREQPPGAWPSHYTDSLASKECHPRREPSDHRSARGALARRSPRARGSGRSSSPAAFCWSACSFRAASAATSARSAR